jgi:A/G-specific adenine glycosylase
MQPTKILKSKEITSFRKTIYDYYRSHGRSLPWRETDDPYRVFVSEVMLQQTQVGRVLEKYEPFIRRFPDFPALARASLSDILALWQGLGYNRRAIYLKQAAEIVTEDFRGILPRTAAELMRLPGVGSATASAVMAFAFNQPVVFIETNIRTVFIHFFFTEKKGVRDDDILPLVELTLDRENPQVWYWALMDYGVMLKNSHRGINERSAHYTRQSPFAGSDREVRGAVLRALLARSPMSGREITKSVGMETRRVKKNLAALTEEGFVVRRGRKFRLA